MSAQPVQHLHIIDGATGEALDECPGCRARDDVITGLERDIRGWAMRYQDLKRDREKEAREDPRWPDAVRLFRLYCRLTGKGGKPRKLTWTVERFWLCEPFLRKHGIGMCERAIVGRVFDHYSAKRKNGSTIRYFEWERIFANAKEFEESANRAPKDFVSELEAEDEAKGGS
jgi:hypothetical protein